MEILEILGNILLHFELFPLSYFVIGVFVIFCLVSLVASISRGG